jgi:hypothetical protein
MKLSPVALQQSIRTFAAGILALSITYFCNSQLSTWLVLTALIIVQIRFSSQWIKQLFLQAVVGLVLSGLIFSTYYLQSSFWCVTGFLVLIIFLSIYWSFTREEFFLPGCLIGLLVIIANGVAVNFQEALLRSEYILTGACVAMLITAVFWPASVRRESNMALTMCLQTCKQLIATIFNIYLRRDYVEQHLIYEKEIYQLNQQFFYYKKDLRGQHPAVDIIFEIIMSLGGLRYRIKDYATLEIINDELKDVSYALQEKLTQQPDASTDLLMVSIAKLEEAYRSTLQVAAKEPRMFLFFISNLKALVLYFETEQHL